MILKVISKYSKVQYYSTTRATVVILSLPYFTLPCFAYPSENRFGFRVETLDKRLLIPALPDSESPRLHGSSTPSCRTPDVDRRWATGDR